MQIASREQLGFHRETAFRRKMRRKFKQLVCFAMCIQTIHI